MFSMVRLFLVYSSLEIPELTGAGFLRSLEFRMPKGSFYSLPVFIFEDCECLKQFHW
jgi:hypothetical protein